MMKVTTEENKLLKWLVVTLITIIFGFIVLAYNDLRITDRNLGVHQGEDEKKFTEISKQLITLNANLNQVCEALSVKCIMIVSPGVALTVNNKKP